MLYASDTEREARTEYDEYGRAVVQRTLMDAETDTWSEVTTVHDEYGRPYRTVYSDGTFEESGFDLGGNRIWERARARYELTPTGEMLVADGEPNVVTRHAFDERNRLIKSCVDGVGVLGEDLLDHYLWSPGCSVSRTNVVRGVSWHRDEMGAVTVTEEDLAGRPVLRCGPFMMDAAEQVDELEISCDGHPEGRTQTAYHAESGRVLWVQDAAGIFTLPVHDASGRRVAECRMLALPAAPEDFSLADAIAAQSNPEDGRTCRTFELDDLGRTVAETDANGKRTEYGHDAAGRLVSVTDAMHEVTRYGFDGLGNMTSQQDARGRITRYEHDAEGRRTARVLPMLQRETSRYGIGGQLASRTDFRGRTTRHVDDDLDGRTDRLDLPTDDDVLTDYRGSGERSEVTVGGTVTAYVPDLETGRLEQVDRTGATSLRYVLDEAGRRITTITDPGGPTQHVTNYEWDVAGRLARVSDAGGAAAYEYDLAGRLRWVRYFPGAATTAAVTGEYVHDSLTGGLRRITWRDAAGAVLLDLDYDAAELPAGYRLDELGRRRGVRETRPTGTRLVRWSFDDLYRLTDESVAEAGDTTETWHVHYEYDAVGNRTRRLRTGTKPEDTYSSYDANDRLLVAGGVTFGWDQNGNLTDKGAVPLEWDEQDRMKRADGAWDFVYDADGLKQATSSPGGDVEHVVDASFPYAQVIEDREGGLVTHRYLHGLHPVRIDASGAAWWYLHDAIGSTRALVQVDAGTGAVSVTDTWDYEAFGTIETHVGVNASGNRWMFAGEERREEIGLDYLRARWMDPGSGRFGSRDAFEGTRRRPETLHATLYANAGPTWYSDPGGTFGVADAAFSLALMSVASFMTGCTAPNTFGLRVPSPIEHAELLKTRAEAADVMRYAIFVAGDVVDSTSYASLPTNTFLLKRWFGATAMQHQEEIQDVLAATAEGVRELHWQVTDIPARASNGGWVIAEAIGPNYLTTIYPEYWLIPSSSVDGASRVSAHVHESVHHVGGSAFWDKRWGFGPARDLASSHPEAARLNPTNYEGFAMEARHEFDPCH